ncbi:hypothetical protein [Sneathiella sp.]|jgi:hypothetical protein|uniref:hypothetical protein n=1 Tax=Sneathiella sp. TaxID=1964365 RepID=UPI0039E336D8
MKILQNLKLLISVLFFSTASFMAHAALVPVAYTGAYNEAGNAPGNDYDGIGGSNDVAVFDLIGTPSGTSNTFTGSVYTPVDSSDAFTIRLSEGQTLTGARIVFGTNLNPFNPLFSAPPPNWSMSYTSGTNPEIFNIPVAPDMGIPSPPPGATAPISSALIPLSLGEGVYNILLGNGTFGTNTGEPVGYVMTFDVTGSPPLSTVPLPAALPLYGAGLGLMAFVGWRRKRKSA